MKALQMLRQWLRERRVRRLKLDQAEILGTLKGCYAAGYENPRLEGKLARVIEQLRQLEAS